MKTKINPFLFLAIVLTVIILFPLATIWSLNTLFQLGIAYSFKTWLAAVFLQMATFGGVSSTIRETSKK